MKIKKLKFEKDGKAKHVARVSYEGEDFAPGFGRMSTEGILFEIHNLPGGYVLCDGISGKPIRVLANENAVLGYFHEKYPRVAIETP